MSGLAGWWRQLRARRRQQLARRPDVGEQMRGASGRNDRDPGDVWTPRGDQGGPGF
jgi:hypothetical protein